MPDKIKETIYILLGAFTFPLLFALFGTEWEFSRRMISNEFTRFLAVYVIECVAVSTFAIGKSIIEVWE